MLVHNILNILCENITLTLPAFDKTAHMLYNNANMLENNAHIPLGFSMNVNNDAVSNQ